MDYDDHRKVEIRAEFARRRRNQLILLIPAIVAMFVAVVSKDTGTILGIPADAFLPTMIVLVAAAVGFSLYNWRCPACSRYLGRSINPKYCVRCGVQLRD